MSRRLVIASAALLAVLSLGWAWIGGPNDTNRSKYLWADNLYLSSSKTQVTATATELSLTDGMIRATAKFAGGIAQCTLVVSGLVNPRQLQGLHVFNSDSAYALTFSILNPDSALVLRPSDDVTAAGLDSVQGLFIPNL